MDTLAKMSKNIFAYSFVSEHSQHLFYFENSFKNFSGARRGRPWVPSP